MKKILLLGSTGSIGVSTLDVVKAFPAEFRLESLVAGRNLDRLRRQIQEFTPRAVGVADPAAARALKKEFPGLKVSGGEEGIVELVRASRADLAVAAIVGEAGLKPAFAALQTGKDLALANKEALVMAGTFFTAEARKRKRVILPIDSEHCALHQALRSGKRSEVRRLILTASGGPFWRRPLKDFQNIRVEDALKHPTWKMGPKITIDSATLGNKALEVIEAHFLFGLKADRISVVIHPQSIIHSIAEWRDGSMIAQMGVNDMRFPIQYALTYPRRLATPHGFLKLEGLKLEFHEPDGRKFPLLGLGVEALRRGGAYPAAFSLANELAVMRFLERGIRFMDIPRIVEQVLGRLGGPPPGSLEELLALCARVRRSTLTEMKRLPKGVH